jgi:hypothetical protein
MEESRKLLKEMILKPFVWQHLLFAFMVAIIVAGQQQDEKDGKKYEKWKNCP